MAYDYTYNSKDIRTRVGDINIDVNNKSLGVEVIKIDKSEMSHETIAFNVVDVDFLALASMYPNGVTLYDAIKAAVWSWILENKKAYIVLDRDPEETDVIPDWTEV